VCLARALSSYFTRGTLMEHLNFATRTVIQRTKAGTRQSVGLTDNPFLVHTYVRFDGLAGIVVTQKDYAVRVAYTLLNKMMADYEQYYPTAWKTVKADVTLEPEFMKKDIIVSAQHHPHINGACCAPHALDQL
jgi:ribosomal protein L21E